MNQLLGRASAIMLVSCACVFSAEPKPTGTQSPAKALRAAILRDPLNTRLERELASVQAADREAYLRALGDLSAGLTAYLDQRFNVAEMKLRGLIGPGSGGRVAMLAHEVTGLSIPEVLESITIPGNQGLCSTCGNTGWSDCPELANPRLSPDDRDRLLDCHTCSGRGTVPCARCAFGRLVMQHRQKKQQDLNRQAEGALVLVRHLLGRGIDLYSTRALRPSPKMPRAK